MNFMNWRFYNFFVIFIAIVVLVGGGYFIWDRFFDETARANRFLNKQLAVYEKAEKAYVEAMTADTYGGKTPQETLDMFVDALKKGDVELASKYFLIDENANREKWAQLLSENKTKGLFSAMTKDFSKAQFYKIISDREQQFIIYNDDKTDSLIVT